MNYKDARTRKWTETSPGPDPEESGVERQAGDNQEAEQNMIALTSKPEKYALKPPVMFGSLRGASVSYNHMRRYRVFRSPEESVIQTTVELPGRPELREEYNLALVERSNASQVHVLHAAHRGLSQLLTQIEVTMAQILANKTVVVDPDSPLYMFLQQRPYIMTYITKDQRGRMVPISEQSIDTSVLRLLHLYALFSV